MGSLWSRSLFPLLRSYQASHTQVVSIDESTSASLPLLYGVPQRSILLNKGIINNAKLYAKLESLEWTLNGNNKWSTLRNEAFWEMKHSKKWRTPRNEALWEMKHSKKWSTLRNEALSEMKSYECKQQSAKLCQYLQ